ncbi:MAG TPA: glycosyltransferase family 4 protein [Candidatus Sulfopaludibacter sp.]|jgi:glycosyltransferase involved in cell wall biosynthesis|nr:glycosyltransferase family 4 protein [Candidatus Sulfopaludibacter sp.]
MRHLIVCREYPPAPYPPGGIGTYVVHIARLLAQAGETVHVLAQRWEGAPRSVTESCGGKLIVHRVSLDEPLPKALSSSDCPSQAFAWQTARLAERLIEEDGVDLIEAPEWEASLYYLQVRRALGLGPKRRPPCLVHLHSPAELIVRHNQWDPTLTDLAPLCRAEAYTIRAADALLCPSRYLARGVQELYSLPDAEIAVIPYPLGDTPAIERAAPVWARDAILYIGRLELRKGVMEWVDAAVEVAAAHSQVEFHFVGSDTSLDGAPGSSVQARLEARIPRSLRGRFYFQPSQTKPKLRELLAASPVAVVPSRWENLPYTCIEAMCTGLPVMVSPNGGMRELVTDGESGWVSADVTPAGLAAALRRVLATPPAQRAAMGRHAEAAVRGICSNEAVLRQHLELRSRLAQRPPSSVSVPVPTDRDGMGVVVTCLERPELLNECLAAIANQTMPPRAIVAVVDERFAIAALPGCKVVPLASPSLAAARSAGVAALFAESPRLLAAAFLTQSVRLEPVYLSRADAAFRSRPDLGVLSCMLRYPAPENELDAGPSPLCEAVRAEAVDSHAGWSAMTYPDILATVAAPRAAAPKRYSAMALSQAGSPKLVAWFLAAPLVEKARFLGRVLSRPRRLGQWLVWQLRGAR